MNKLWTKQVLPWIFQPRTHTLSKGESACHLIHLEPDLEREPDLELDELPEPDLQNKTEPFQYFFSNIGVARFLLLCLNFFKFEWFKML